MHTDPLQPAGCLLKSASASTTGLVVAAQALHIEFLSQANVRLGERDSRKVVGIAEIHTGSIAETS